MRYNSCVYVFSEEHKKEIAPRSTSKKSKVHTKLSASNANHEDTSEEEESTEVRTETHKTTESIRVEHDSDETDSDEEGDPSKLIHESLLKDKGSKGASKGKAKFIPSDETLELRRARTIFVGNVPVEVVKGKVRIKRSSSSHSLIHAPFVFSHCRSSSSGTFCLSFRRQKLSLSDFAL